MPISRGQMLYICKYLAAREVPELHVTIRDSEQISRILAADCAANISSIFGLQGRLIIGWVVGRLIGPWVPCRDAPLLQAIRTMSKRDKVNLASQMRLLLSHIGIESYEVLTLMLNRPEGVETRKYIVDALKCLCTEQFGPFVGSSMSVLF